MVLDVGFMRPLLVWRGYWIYGENVMSEFKGTPGPWGIDKYGDVTHGNANRRGNRESVKVCGVSLPGRATEEYKANSMIVAAAPELLEALQELVHADCHGVRNSPAQVKALNKAMLAIDKALGL